MERISTGVHGLDKLLEGGYGKGFLVEVAGSAGTYKSTFALQFAIEGIKMKEAVTYISLEESRESFRQLADDLNVGKEFAKIDFQTIEINDIINTWYSINASKGVEMLARMIIERVDQPDRLVLDTATTMALYSSRTEVKLGENNKSQYLTPSTGDTRVMLLYLADELRRKKTCTSMLLAEAGEGELYMPEEMLKYICDGKIELRKSFLGTRTPRSLVIEKMRHTNHSLDEQPIIFTKDGLKIEEIEQG